MPLLITALLFWEEWSPINSLFFRKTPLNFDCFEFLNHGTIYWYYCELITKYLKEATRIHLSFLSPPSFHSLHLNLSINHILFIIYHLSIIYPSVYHQFIIYLIIYFETESPMLLRLALNFGFKLFFSLSCSRIWYHISMSQHALPKNRDPEIKPGIVWS